MIRFNIDKDSKGFTLKIAAVSKGLEEYLSIIFQRGELGGDLVCFTSLRPKMPSTTYHPEDHNTLKCILEGVFNLVRTAKLRTSKDNAYAWALPSAGKDTIIRIVKAIQSTLATVAYDSPNDQAGIQKSELTETIREAMEKIETILRRPFTQSALMKAAGSGSKRPASSALGFAPVSTDMHATLYGAAKKARITANMSLGGVSDFEERYGSRI